MSYFLIKTFVFNASIIFVYSSHPVGIMPDSVADKKYIRTNVYASVPTLEYKFTLRGCPELYVFDDGKFNKMNGPMFCSAINSLISTYVYNINTIISIESTSFKSFTVLFVCLKSTTYVISVQVKFTQEGQILVSKISSNNEHSHKYFPSEYKNEVICVFGIEARYGELYDELIVEKIPQNDTHSSVDCFGATPNLYVRCSRCLVFSFDGKNHVTPCAPINTISIRRKNILAKNCFPMFSMKVNSVNDIFYLNSSDGKFIPIQKSKLLSPSTDGFFSFSSSENFNFMSYTSSQYHRFSVIFAILINGLWRLRLNAVTTAKSGLKLFKLTSTLSKIDGLFKIPSGYALQNVLLVGIKPKNIDALELDFKIYANSTGIISLDPFDGYFCNVKFNNEKMAGCFDFEEDDEVKMFSRNIRAFAPPSLSGFRDQQLETDLI